MLEVVPMHLRPMLAGFSIWHYLQKLLIPWPLTVDYGLKPKLVTAVAINWAFAGAAVLVVIMIATVRPLRKWGLVPLAVMLLALMPVLGFASFIFQLLLHGCRSLHVPGGWAGPAPRLGGAENTGQLVAIRGRRSAPLGGGSFLYPAGTWAIPGAERTYLEA